MYIIGGDSFIVRTSVFYFDILKGEWRDCGSNKSSSSIGPMGPTIYHATTFAGDSIILLSSTAKSRAWRFDLVLEKWIGSDSNSAEITSRFAILEYIEHRNVCIHFGGREYSSNPSSELNALRLDDMMWYEPTVKGQSPLPCSHMASCVVGTTVYCFGGRPRVDDLRLLHCSGLGAVVWSVPKLLGKIPPSRHNSTITYLFSGKLLIVGGFSDQFFQDMWIYSIADKTWTELEPGNTIEGQIPRISQHGAGYFGNKLILTGAHDRRLVDGFVTLQGL